MDLKWPLEILEELFWPIIHDEFIRKADLLHKRHDAAVVRYLKRDMRIAAEYQRNIMFLAKPKNFQIVCDSARLFPLRGKRMVVDFQQSVSLF